jgi:hypothetical protein
MAGPRHYLTHLDDRDFCEGSGYRLAWDQLPSTCRHMPLGLAS